MSNAITIDELILIQKKLWATTSDIQRIGGIGYNKARIMKNSIRDQLHDEGWALPQHEVPMSYVIDRFPDIKRRLETEGGVSIGG